MSFYCDLCIFVCKSKQNLAFEQQNLLKIRFFFLFSCLFTGKWLPLQHFLTHYQLAKDEKVTFIGISGSWNDV